MCIVETLALFLMFFFFKLNLPGVLISLFQEVKRKYFLLFFIQRRLLSICFPEKGGKDNSASSFYTQLQRELLYFSSYSFPILNGFSPRSNTSLTRYEHVNRSFKIYIECFLRRKLIVLI